MEENKKYYLDVLDIILGTQCNLKCRHCMGGSPPNHLTMNMSCIDNLTTDIYGINKLSFIGYETTLYIPLMKKVFDKLISSNIPINKILVCTNGKEYSQELVDSFRYVSNKVKKPDRNRLSISDDIFHLKQINSDNFQKNVEKYTHELTPKLVALNRLDSIILNGNARNLNKNEILKAGVQDIEILRHGIIENIVIFDEYKRIGESDGCADDVIYKNYIVSPIVISPNGFIYVCEIRAFNDLALGRNTEGIANLSKQRLRDIIYSSDICKDNISLKYDNTIVVQSPNDYNWKLDYELFRIVCIEEKYSEMFEDRNYTNFKMFDRIAANKDWYLSIENPDKLPNVSKILYSLYLNEIENIKSIRIFFNYLKPSNQNTRFADYRKRINNRHSETVSAITEIWGDYNVWRKKWQAYENWDIDEFAKNTEYILQELDKKINSKEV